MGIVARRWIVIAIAALGCGREGGIEPSEEPAPRIVWISPAEGDSLSDSLRMEVTHAGAAAIRFSVEDSTLARVQTPPWRCVWLPGGGARSMTLAAETVEQAGRSVDRSTTRVHWSPNRPPEMSWIGAIAWPGVARSSIDSLRVEAIDPEEGRLPGNSIEWFSDRQGFLGVGGALPTEALLAGNHAIGARARDRWGRAASAERRLVAFDYGDGNTAEGTIEDLRHAWLAGDFGRYADLLADGFRFVFCPADRREDPEMPVAWERAEEERFARSLREKPGIAVARFEWERPVIREVRLPGGDWSQAEITGLEFDLAIGGPDTLRVRQGRARVWLRRGADGEPWRVEQWSDLGAGASQSLGLLRIQAP